MPTRICNLMLVEVNASDAVKASHGKKARQSNKFYNMTDNGSEILVEYGRVDTSCTKITKPLSKWDSIIKSKLKKGYHDVTHLVSEVEEEASDNSSSSAMADISDRVIDKLFKELQAYADETIKAHYKVNAKKVTQSMVDEAQGWIDELAKILKAKKRGYVFKFNAALLNLFHVIPRRMQDVSAWLVDETYKSEKLYERCIKIMGKEQATLDVMAGQVLVVSKTDAAVDVEQAEPQNDILSILGLEVIEVTDEETDIITKLMGVNHRQFRRAYKVINSKTQQLFDAHIATVDNTTKDYFWHGSGNANWLNILSTGLLIRPSGAGYHGSMYGDGIYFADKAQKSIGYTSLRGSYWNNGVENKAYLALFDVHVGNQWNIRTHTYSHSSLSLDGVSKKGYDSVFAEAGTSLRNNEFIIYNNHQCTVSYLVGIGT